MPLFGTGSRKKFLDAAKEGDVDTVRRSEQPPWRAGHNGICQRLPRALGTRRPTTCPLPGRSVLHLFMMLPGDLRNSLAAGLAVFAPLAVTCFWALGTDRNRAQLRQCHTMLLSHCYLPCVQAAAVREGA